MSDKEELYQSIERYLAEEMEAEELSRFEEKLATDAALKAEVRLHRELAESVTEQAGTEKLIEDLNEIHRESPAEYSKSGPRKLLWAAAAVVLLFFLAWVVYDMLFDEGKDPQTLYAEYYEVYPALDQKRDANAESDELNQALASYRKGEYRKALNGFQKSFSTPVASDFYSGICFMELQKPDSAIYFLSLVVDEGDNLLMNQAQWYLALSYLSQGEVESAILILNKIITNEGSYLERARQLKSELQK